MNKLETFVQLLRDAGLSERQIERAVDALNEYNNARVSEMSVREGRKGECE